VTTDTRGRARIVVWDRQGRRNAWDLKTMTAIADAVEQAVPADPQEDGDDAATVHRGLDVEREVNEWDAVEQARVVPLDDDDR
jgi:hypothetical protein